MRAYNTFGDSLSIKQVLGIVLVVIGTVVVNWQSKEKEGEGNE